MLLRILRFGVVVLKKDIFLMKLVVVSLFISSFSLLLSFFGSYSGNVFNFIMALMTGILFWIGLIVGYVFLVIVNSHRNRTEKKDTDGMSKSKKQKTKPGIICFLSNKYAAVADVAMVLFLVLSLVFLFIPSLSQGIALVFVSFFLFSLHMHCIFNGVNFRYINSIDKKESSK